MGFVPTGEDSPVDESGKLWSKGHELVCDETSIVIDGNHHVDDDDDEREKQDGRVVHRYDNSKKVRLPGGFERQYEY
jgi:hypothetical protein